MSATFSLPSVPRHPFAQYDRVAESHVFEMPTKLIKTPADMIIWEKSEAYFEYLGFILAINDAIKGKSNSQGSENVSRSAILLVGVLEKLDAFIDETPPVQQPQRFGNIAFRTWYDKMKDGAMILLQEVVDTHLYKSLHELIAYLVDSFGNQTRIDYGTGHEISFVMFLCCLFKIGLLVDTDKIATGCYIFPRYLDLVRKLQKTYRMEPAGSHGVWSLDDYQFVPFIWGSSQLFAHPVIEPALFLKEQIVNEYGEDYMFLTCIQYINSVKTGPFAEHSNQLWSISGVSSWGKINGGLVKMYKAEVLCKFPVVQHIVFGSLFTLKPIEQSIGFMTPKQSLPRVASLLLEKSSSSISTVSAPSIDEEPELNKSEDSDSLGVEEINEAVLEESKSSSYGGDEEKQKSLDSLPSDISENFSERTIHTEDRESVKFKDEETGSVASSRRRRH